MEQLASRGGYISVGRKSLDRVNKDHSCEVGKKAKTKDMLEINEGENS